MGVLVTVQSANRPYQVPVMLKALRGVEPIWYVPAGQEEEYAAEGAKVRRVVGELPMKTKQLNAALDDSNGITVTMDDDYVTSSLLLSENPRRTKRIYLDELITILVGELIESPFYLAGIAGTSDSRNAFLLPKTYGMVTGQILAHKQTPLRFDENLGMLEDLDFIISHHQTFGGLHKNRAILPEFHIFGRNEKSDAEYKGGYDKYRTEELQQITLQQLTNKYPNLVFENNGLGKSVQRLVNFRKLANEFGGK